MTVTNGESKGRSEMAPPKASTALGNTGPPLCKECLCVIHLPTACPTQSQLPRLQQTVPLSRFITQGLRAKLLLDRAGEFKTMALSFSTWT